MNTSIAAALLALTTAGFAAHAQNSDKRGIMGEEYARQKVRAATKDSEKARFPNPLLPSKAVAIASVEPLLFNGFGKAVITHEQPYEAYLVDGFWYISGTLPKRYTRGGVFEIIVDANNGRVISLTHGR